jgi:peroxiredoxin Q/BCP
MNARVHGISQDSVESHRRFREKYALELDLLSDPEGTTMRQFGALVKTQFAGVTSERVVRCTYLIDPTGYVRFHWPEVIPRGHAERVKNKLAELKS